MSTPDGPHVSVFLPWPLHMLPRKQLYLQKEYMSIMEAYYKQSPHTRVLRRQRRNLFFQGVNATQLPRMGWWPRMED